MKELKAAKFKEDLGPRNPLNPKKCSAGSEQQFTCRNGTECILLISVRRPTQAASDLILEEYSSANYFAGGLCDINPPL